MYTPQIEDLKHTLKDIVGLEALLKAGVFGDLSFDVVEAILEEGGKFARDVIAPLNRVGDEHGCVFDTQSHDVTTAPGWKEAYQQWTEGGWAALPCDEEFGGQGLPLLVGLAAQELWNTAASAFGIGTLLTQGAINALKSHGSDEIKQAYLAKMVSGQWTGTMCLTESQAGSDLGALKAKAVPNEDGSYSISGTKIFITYGEHDLIENIIHLVLARLADAPAGSRGISLFVVPKFLLNEDGSPGKRNDVKCVGLEHKLGIHGSPTATMQFGDDGGAIGWLVGQENRGLNCMFTMMNDARLHVGMQGVAVAERALQQALAFAKERKQSARPGSDGPVAIIEHPDVARMLLEMKAKTAAARAICYECARALDLAEHRDAEHTGDEAQAALGALLTPVNKAFGTDIGSEVASLGVQVHGGMGYIEETGAAQHLRDARITQIYEGTNGIQALDLVGRKLPLGNGQVVKDWLASQRAIADGLSGDMAGLKAPLTTAIDAMERATTTMLSWLVAKDERALAAATSYLRAFALVAGTAAMAKGAAASGDEERKQLVRYFTSNHLVQVAGLVKIVENGAGDILETASILG